MDTSRIRTIVAATAVTGVAAAAIVVAPSLAAEQKDPAAPAAKAKAKGEGPGKGKGKRDCAPGPGGRAEPAALRLAHAALRPDPPARGEGRGGNGGKPAAKPEKPDAPKTAAERLERRATHLAAIGRGVGKSGDEVNAAVRSALAAEVAARVKDGDITQARADAILKTWDTGEPAAKDAQAKPAEKKAGARRGQRPGRRAIDGDVQAFRAAVAKDLGVSVADLEKAIEAAKPAGKQGG